MGVGVGVGFGVGVGLGGFGVGFGVQKESPPATATAPPPSPVDAYAQLLVGAPDGARATTGAAVRPARVTGASTRISRADQVRRYPYTPLIMGGR
ncbi:hypothetical protein ACIQXD_03655 [Streptomyces uncialis]|uniref:hypothetical protein n=1 Tax=Streptomyces uncialis TaxID=1048205 RepID=UPI00380DF5BD